MLRISWLSCIFRYSPENKVLQHKQGKFSNQYMAYIQYISEIHPTLGFTELGIFQKNTTRVLMRVSSAGFTQFFRLGVWQKLQNCPKQRMGRRNTFIPSAKIALMVLKSYIGFSDRHIVEYFNGNLHYRMF